MMLDIATALIWLLFLALFPMAFIWLRRAWKIFIKRDYSEVALKRGESPPNPKKWAPVCGALNLLAGTIALWIVVGLPLFIFTGLLIGPFHNFDAWSALAGSTIWIKIFADFILGRQAHPYTWGKKKKSS